MGKIYKVNARAKSRVGLSRKLSLTWAHISSSLSNHTLQFQPTYHDLSPHITVQTLMQSNACLASADILQLILIQKTDAVSANEIFVCLLR